MIDLRIAPAEYRHWRLEFDAPIAHLILQVNPSAPLTPGYELKLNSYDLSVDIELSDAIQRLRFEHPEIRTVILRSGRDNVFCAGANIRMLGQSSHGHKVNFCKFTNETRLAIEDASAHSGQTWLCAIAGPAAGGGYELALACEHIMLIDDRRSSISLPELPLLAVLPGTGGLTRVTDKRKVRRDLADLFCTAEEGVRGKRAVQWRLVDEVVPPSGWAAAVAHRALALAARSDRPADAPGVQFTPLDRVISDETITYPHLTITLDRPSRRATFCLRGPTAPPPSLAEALARGDAFWPLAMARALDDAILHLRFNEPELGLWLLRTEGEAAGVLAHDEFLTHHAQHWAIREITLYLKRTFKRLDVTSRSLIALIEPGSCFAGSLAELAFAADRSLMLDGPDAASLTLSPMNFGPLPMGNGLTRLATRFLGEPETLARAETLLGQPLSPEAAATAGLVTAAVDATDWADELRILLEERASFSADSLTGLEANLRFAGPETMETRIFGRLTAWQNWIFLRPNAAGEHGALKRYGTGQQPQFDHHRI